MTQLPAADLNALKVADLRALLAEKGLPTTGKKTELIERLQAASQVSSAPPAESSGGVQEITSPEVPVAAPAAAGGLIETSAAKATETVSEPAAPSAAGASPAIPVITPNMTEEEKLAARKAKFGIKTDQDKLQERAKRFGTFDPTVEEEKKKQRAQRFGLSTSGANSASSSGIQGAEITTDEAEKRKKRAERFGIVDEEERKRKRAERFGTVSEEEKLQKRLQRFAGSATA